MVMERDVEGAHIHAIPPPPPPNCDSRCNSINSDTISEKVHVWLYVAGCKDSFSSPSRLLMIISDELLGVQQDYQQSLSIAKRHYTPFFG